MTISFDLTGAFIYALGAFSGYATVRYRLTVSDRSSQLSDHLKDIEKLHEAAIAFWSNPCEAEKGNEKRMRVLSSHAIAMRIYPQISQMALKRSTAYEDLISLYFRACSGGDFDDPNRAANLVKVMELSGIHSQLVELLRLIRQDLGSVRMLAKDLFTFFKRVWSDFHNVFLKP